MNVRMKKMLERKHARSEAPEGDHCAIICNASCDNVLRPGAFVVQQKRVSYDEATASYE